VKRPYPEPMPPARTRRARAARKRQRRMAAVEHDLSPSEWSALQDAWGGCAYCGATGTPLQKDCVLPISRGGRYTLLNVVPACASCNASKCNDEVTGWLRRKRLDERAFLVRLATVQAELRHPVEVQAPTTECPPAPPAAR
jgi:5-methylcytosine-specific restriction endonuclease McrA